METEQKEKNWNKNPFILRMMGMGESYFVKTPWWLKKIYPHRLWNKDNKEKIIYLTFDDGPHPVATPFVLEELRRHDAKATFFCIGKNVVDHPAIYRRLLDEGHNTGNHTHTHPNGWATPTNIYLKDITEASKHIDSVLFRPPYGRIKSAQSRGLQQAMGNRSSKIVMWDVLSGDFDETLSVQDCYKNVTGKATSGSIVVFHDSEKAFRVLKEVLPAILQFFAREGYVFKSL